MKKKSTSQLVRHSLGEGGSAPARRSPWPAVVSRRRRLGEGGFFNLRVLFASVFCLAGVLIALGGAGLYLGSSKAQAQPGAESAAVTANSANGPDVVRLVGPVVVNTDLRDLPYIPPAPRILKQLLVPRSMGRDRSATNRDAPLCAVPGFDHGNFAAGPYDATAAADISRDHPS